MDATTQQPAVKLFTVIKKHFIEKYTFNGATEFYWRPNERVVSHGPMRSNADVWQLLHELGHAELTHKDFFWDIELIRQEVAAWQHAREILGPTFGVIIDTAYIQDCLETYRQWLHLRSLCIDCQQTGLQTQKSTYRCINCGCSWSVNDARKCALKRTKMLGQDRSASLQMSAVPKPLPCDGD